MNEVGKLRKGIVQNAEEGWAAVQRGSFPRGSDRGSQDAVMLGS